jgi:hypothetical protein
MRTQRTPANDQYHIGGEVLAELPEVAQHTGRVVGVDDAEGNGARIGGGRRTRDLAHGQVAAQEEHAPTLRGRGSSGERCRDHVTAAGRCGDDDRRRPIRDRHRAHRVDDECLDDRRRHVLVRNRQASGVPLLADLAK